MKKILLIFCTFLLCGCQFRPLQHPAKNPSPHTTAYLLSNGWHTSLLIPSSALNREIPALIRSFPNHSNYYEIGWGDADFYQSREEFPPISMVFRSLFASRASVIHLAARDFPPLAFARPTSQQIPLLLSEENLQNLAKHLAKSFTLNAQQQPIYLGVGLSEHSAFFASSAQYHWYFTCNTWTATALQQAGYKLHPYGKLTASSLTSRFAVSP